MNATLNCLSTSEWYELQPPDRWRKENVLAVLVSNACSIDELPKEMSSAILWCQEAPYELCFDFNIFWMWKKRFKNGDSVCWLRELPESYTGQIAYGILVIYCVCGWCTEQEPSVVRDADRIMSVFAKFPRLRSDPAVWNCLVEGVDFGSNEMTQSDFCRCLEEWSPEEILENKETMLRLLRLAEYDWGNCPVRIYGLLPDKFKNDENVVEIMDIISDYWSIYDLPWSLQTKSPALVILRLDELWDLKPWGYRNDDEDALLHPDLFTNREIIRAWIIKGGCFYAILDDFEEMGLLPVFPEECLEIISNDAELLLLIAEYERKQDSFGRIASDAMRSSKAFMLKVVEEHGWLLTRAIGDLQYDFDLALVAFASNPDLVSYFWSGVHSFRGENRLRFGWPHDMYNDIDRFRDKDRDRKFLTQLSQHVQERIELHKGFTIVSLRAILLDEPACHLSAIAGVTGCFIVQLIADFSGSILDEKEWHLLVQTAAHLDQPKA